MNIAILNPKSDFTADQLKRLSSVGKVTFLDTKERPLKELVDFCKGAEVIAIDPFSFGGFEKAKPAMTKLMASLPKLQGIALDTTSFGWIDLDYTKKRGIIVTNVPGYSRESVAEHALGFLLCLAKLIVSTDRKTQKGEYKLEKGVELKGKTLGIIGLGSIGSRMAELGQGIGMNVIASNRSSKKQKGVEIISLDKLLKTSDAISLHVTDENSNHHLIGEKELANMKDDVMIVNTVDRDLVDEKAMAAAIKTGKVFGYALEAEELVKTPLSGLDRALLFQGFGWYTKESLINWAEVWADTIVSLTKDKPINVVNQKYKK